MPLMTYDYAADEAEQPESIWREYCQTVLRGFDGLHAAVISGVLVIGAAIVLWDIWSRL